MLSLRPEGNGGVCVSLCVLVYVLVGEHKECLKYVEGGGCFSVVLGSRAGDGRADALP